MKGGSWFPVSVSSLFMSGIVCIAVVFSCPAASARSGACSGVKSEQANGVADAVTGWQQYLAWYRAYRPCEDSATAEIMSDKTEMLLGMHWDDFMALSQKFTGDTALRMFLLKHLNSTSSGDYLEAIQENAAENCTASDTVLCGAISLAVQRIRRVRG